MHNVGAKEHGVIMVLLLGLELYPDMVFHRELESQRRRDLYAFVLK